MRLITLSKVTSAFPELDRLSDEQRRELCHRALASVAGLTEVGIMSIIAFAAFFLSAIGALILVIPLALELVPSRLRGHLPWAEELVMVAIAIPLLLAAGIGALRVRDVLLGRLLREALRGRLKKLRCPGCRYSLIGLRVSGDVVRCPECGGAVTLAELGLDSPDDLLPPVDAPPHDDPEAGARSAPD